MTESIATDPIRRRGGCLRGCLSGLLLLIAAGVAVTLGLSAVLAPWNFYFGGHFHLIPGWQGWGQLHSASAGGNYSMWIRLVPTTPRFRASPLSGVAYLCTPRGERFRLVVHGDMPRSHGTDLTGVPIHLYMHSRVSFWNFSADSRPSIDLYGSFGDSVLNMEDRGSLTRAFDADGTLPKPNVPNRPVPKDDVHVTFKESSYWVISPGCPAVQPP